jgi:hypothetical protein
MCLRLFLASLVAMANSCSKEIRIGENKGGAHAATGNYRSLLKDVDGSDNDDRRRAPGSSSVA